MGMKEMFQHTIDLLTGKTIPDFVVESANKVVQDARKNASWSSTIPGAIELGKVYRKNFIYTAEVIVDLSPDKAPEARAFELGSGIHGKTKATYPIIPKNAPMLAFYWDKVDETTRPGKKFIGIAGSGKALFRYVDHPGVQARPFLRPAVINNLNFFQRNLITRINAVFKEAINDF